MKVLCNFKNLRRLLPKFIKHNFEHVNLNDQIFKNFKQFLKQKLLADDFSFTPQHLFRNSLLQRL